MPTASHNLHGSAPEKSETALLLIDVINGLEVLVHGHAAPLHVGVWPEKRISEQVAGK